MKSLIRNLICIFSLIILIFSCKRPDVSKDILKLDEGWKISSFDSIQFSMSDYNDQNWKTFSPDKSIRNNQYQGIRWYRMKVIIPSSLYKNSYFKDSLQFSPGIIHGNDQTYLNGFVLGQKGIVLEKDHQFAKRNEIQLSHNDEPVNYKLAVNDPRIFWDQINTLSIRIYADSGFEGLNSKSASISMVDLKDYIFFNINKEAFVYESGYYSKQIELINTLNKSFSGYLSIIVQDTDSQEIIYKNTEKMKLEAKSSFIQLFAFKDSKASHYQIKYSFKAKDSNNIIERVEFLPSKN